MVTTIAITTFSGMLQQEADDIITWRRHQMEAFSALLAFCVGNSPVTGEFPAQRPVTQSFDVFFDLCLNKQLSKQSWGWWLETPSRSLWRQCKEMYLDNLWWYLIAAGYHYTGSHWWQIGIERLDMGHGWGQIQFYPTYTPFSIKYALVYIFAIKMIYVKCVECPTG